MSRRLSSLVALASLCSFAPGLSAQAATQVLIDSRKVADPEFERTEIWAEAGRMRVDVAGGKHSIIYSVDQGIVWALDHERGSVLKLDRSTASGVASALVDVESGLRARTSELPPEARAAAESLLDSTFGPESTGPARAFAVRSTDQVGKVRGIDCRVRELWVDAQREARFCEATLSAAALPPDALAPVRALAVFARDISGLLPDRLRSDGLAALDLFDRVEGVPLEIDLYEGESLVREAIVREVRQGEPPAGAFVVPPEYSSDIAIRVRERLGGP